MQQPAKGILPIFNRKKRPRQAIFTYPNKNNDSSNNAGDASGSSTQFGNTAPTQQPGYMQSKQPQRLQQYNNNNNTGFQSVRNNYGNANKPTTNNRPSTGTSGPPKQPGFLGTKPSNAKPPNRGMPQGNQSNPRQQFTGQPSYNQRNNQGPQQHGANSSYGAGGSTKANLQQYRSTPQQGRGHQTSSISKPTPGSKRPYNPPVNQSSPRGPPSSYNKGAQYGGQNAQTSQQNPTSHNTNSRPAVLLPFQGPGAAATTTTAAVLDKTVKILTSSVEGMKHWSQYSDTVGLLLFEIFGILNSATTTDELGDAKLFSLKDGQHSQKCIFYETDRHLPRFTRGQWLRCVGSLEKKSGLFRVVTVRQASQQEKATNKGIIAKCDQAMNERLAEMQEP